MNEPEKIVVGEQEFAERAGELRHAPVHEEWDGFGMGSRIYGEEEAMSVTAIDKGWHDRSLRDDFAMEAFKAAVIRLDFESSPKKKGKPSSNNHKEVAKRCYAVADAMMEARKQPEVNGDASPSA